MSATRPCVLVAAGPPSEPTTRRVRHDGDLFIVTTDEGSAAVPDGELVDHLMADAVRHDASRSLFLALTQVDDVVTLSITAYRDAAGWADVCTGEPLSEVDLRTRTVLLLAALAMHSSDTPTESAA